MSEPAPLVTEGDGMNLVEASGGSGQGHHKKVGFVEARPKVLSYLNAGPLETVERILATHAEMGAKLFALYQVLTGGSPQAASWSAALHEILQRLDPGLGDLLDCCPSHNPGPGVRRDLSDVVVRSDEREVEFAEEASVLTADTKGRWALLGSGQLQILRVRDQGTQIVLLCTTVEVQLHTMQPGTQSHTLFLVGSECIWVWYELFLQVRRPAYILRLRFGTPEAACRFLQLFDKRRGA
jgi:hypothetical protein|uniref:RanBD1 domain-containing protein n=1 Tax=Eutreptiella gymnastica TaxID=73025 RepID=A0A7S4LMQ2_9EUGL|mmetsp:Transcript_38301/g.63543  ORF Transcript_38301/g.63543 Transcript_38301/m.63543 type:complete len:239 (+) Transcript_38301:39-755(+)